MRNIKRIIIPTFDWSAAPKVKYSDITTRKYSAFTYRCDICGKDTDAVPGDLCKECEPQRKFYEDLGLI